MIDKKFLETRKGYIQEIVGCRCLGHLRPLEQSKEYELHSNIPWALEFEDGEGKDLAFVSMMVGRDPNPPNDECYFFYCYDITHGPSAEIRLWKAEPRVAARVFGGFLNGYLDQSICRHGTEYYPSERQGPDSNGT